MLNYSIVITLFTHAYYMHTHTQLAREPAAALSHTHTHTQKPLKCCLSHTTIFNSADKHYSLSPSLSPCCSSSLLTVYPPAYTANKHTVALSLPLNFSLSLAYPIHVLYVPASCPVYTTTRRVRRLCRLCPGFFITCAFCTCTQTHTHTRTQPAVNSTRTNTTTSAFR